MKHESNTAEGSKLFQQLSDVLDAHAESTGDERDALVDMLTDMSLIAIQRGHDVNAIHHTAALHVEAESEHAL